MTWKQLTERDRREWKLSAIVPHDRDTWGSGVRSAMCAASQLPGRGPTVVDMALYLHVNQKSDDDDDVENKCEECACKSIYVNPGNKMFSILILQFSFNIVFHAILSKLILITVIILYIGTLYVLDTFYFEKNNYFNDYINWDILRF